MSKVNVTAKYDIAELGYPKVDKAEAKVGDDAIDYVAHVKFDNETMVIERKHAHYYKPCPYREVDVYRVIDIFGVTDGCLQHALKKVLVAGGRGAGKDITQDIQEAIDTLTRWQEMRKEEKDAGYV